MKDRYHGTCHCGQVEFIVTEKPEQLVDCNCSICHRIGALWGHVSGGSVQIKAAKGATLAYSHGDHMMAFHTCKTCGCTTHWEPISEEVGNRMSVNFRMCDRSVLEDFEIRRFDGADTWAYLD